MKQNFIKLKGAGMASIGQMFSEFIVVAISQQFGWENLLTFSELWLFLVEDLLH